MDKNFEDYYGILRIDQNASNAVIRKAYLDLVMKHHPDKNLGQTAKQLEFCKRIIKAYQVLSDPMQRKEYDRNYQDRKKRQQTNASQQGRGNKESHGSNSQKNGHFFRREVINKILVNKEDPIANRKKSLSHIIIIMHILLVNKEGMTGVVKMNGIETRLTYEGVPLILCSPQILLRLYYFITMDKNFEDYYDILGVDSKATNATIRKAFQILIKKNHPDKNPRQTASALDSCKRIIKAYKVLSDPLQRKEYDRNYQDRKKRQQSNGNQQGRGNKESHGSNSQKNGHSSGNQEKKKYEHRPKSEHKKENNHNGHSSTNQERSHQQNTGQQRRPNSEQKEKPKPHYNHNAHSSGNQGRHDWRRQDERDRNQSNFKNRDHAYYQESWQEDYDLPGIA
ncbi:uncharacterized protein LOC133839992 [Drosophila sulfurigaster albostrigata]|uniref:uncharacterized protein LOC133839992 n=1 Tax=Drosophila sulfurigaster albostrigata TaxID=89887 RepID=UPI002D21CB18|nr:uncharacterized protein LOC133839992 [Drosophila sulfurigaster albostrigata]